MVLHVCRLRRPPHETPLLLLSVYVLVQAEAGDGEQEGGAPGAEARGQGAGGGTAGEEHREGAARATAEGTLATHQYIDRFQPYRRRSGAM